MNLTEKQLEQISGAIITSFVNLHFLEEVKTLGVFKQRVKNNVKRTLTDLIDIENNYFEKIEKVDDEELGDKLVANKLEFIKWLLNKFNFNDYSKLQEVCIAYSLKPKELTDLSDIILINNGAEEVK
jgi:hypothetical protein|tara:strand:+ start:1202 stop:1582 length:381 start_codon:yes stop_codon:yes gene_type:complete